MQPRTSEENNQAPRLPQIDPITFSALSTLDNFIGKAPLTRQEHAEANKSLQHIVQTIEMLQAAVKEFSRQSQQAPDHPAPLSSSSSGCALANVESSNSIPGNGSRMVNEAAEKIFRNQQGKSTAGV